MKQQMKQPGGPKIAYEVKVRRRQAEIRQRAIRAMEGPLDGSATTIDKNHQKKVGNLWKPSLSDGFSAKKKLLLTFS